MLEKTFLDRLLRHLKVGAVKITYWDGTTATYGQGKPQAHLTIKSPRVIRAMARNVSLGFGEAYMNGEITTKSDLSEVVRLSNQNRRAFQGLAKLRRLTHTKHNRNRRSRQAKQIQAHYDVGNDFYKLWLDKSMTYSCAYFAKPTDSLETAQAQKVDHVLRKLQLKPGMTLLDIGSGWGQLLIRAVQQYGVTGHGITLSKEQYKLSVERAKKLGLADKLTFELINYQDLAECPGLQFDRIVSVGMFEHVGRHNHKKYFQAVDKMLKPGAITVLHTISSQYAESTDAWIDRYIFPGGYLPAVSEVVELQQDFGWRLLDYENLRPHYAKTLHEWHRRYLQHHAAIVKKYGSKFDRMWQLYLSGSESGFRDGALGLSQFVFSKGINNQLPLTREHVYPKLSSKPKTAKK
ncbi:MAG: cyclopropane-fatty-acyl-phospholipid synthase family protein [Candidatus Saccharimonadales bacterium]